MKSGQLKITGIMIHDGCAPWIRKNLKIGILYPFYSFLKESDFYGELDPSDAALPEDFFGEINDSTKISVSALVGCNGSGKSGLVDIALRLFNNVACILSEKYNPEHNFTFIPGLRASLFYSIGQEQYKLSQTGDSMKDLSLTRHSDRKKLSINKKWLGNCFFYTVLLNYSIHAFNIFDYKKEWSERLSDEKPFCWLDSVFHKNDGYTAPIVLNPKRTEGNIDINIENSLANDRLISLLFKRDGTVNSSYAYINENIEISSIKIALDLESVDRKYADLLKWWMEHKADYEREMENMLFQSIVQFWKEKYGFFRRYDDDSEYDTAIKYLVYKTISVANKYDAFDNFHSLSPINNYSMKDIEAWTFELQKLITEIDNDKSHITQRIRQILSFLVYRQYSFSTGEEIRIGAETFSNIPRQYKIDLKKWEMTDLVPPHCFNTQIFVRNKETEDEFPFSQLSSGERQMSYVSSTVIYHLKNLNSVPKNIRRAKYRYANIILDEIELYFHPEYQRKFVEHILNCIRTAELKEIKSVNILMITHSPFILSDIPKSNVLFLKDGKPFYNMQENTFAANIHSLLRNGFFLEKGSIGSFARKKIDMMFGILQAGTSTKEMRQQIMLVSEPILRSQLLKLYNEQIEREYPIKDVISSLIERIEYLESKLNSEER